MAVSCAPAGEGGEVSRALPTGEHVFIEALYLHVPFCVSRCAYCGFYSQATCAGDARIAAYVACLRSLVARLGSVGMLRHVKTAYIGGGTPTLAGEQLVELAREVSLQCPELVEFTSEANPDSLSESLALGLRHAGITRVSLGVQSLSDAELRGLGRAHTSRQALEAARVVKAAGLDLSCDLMCGIPGQTPASWQASLEGVLAAGADHVSCYPLSIEEGTPFDDAVLADAMQLPDADLQADMMLEAARVLGEAGFERYEVASYARPDHACRHNIAYWTGACYLGLGAAAASMLTPGLACEVGEILGLCADGDGADTGANLADALACRPDAARVRLSFPDDSEAFVHAVSATTGFHVFLETLTSREAAAEDLMLAMRMVRGATREVLEGAVRRGVPADKLDAAVKLACKDGLAELDATGSLCPTQKGWLLGNELFGIMWDTAGD